MASSASNDFKKRKELEEARKAGTAEVLKCPRSNSEHVSAAFLLIESRDESIFSASARRRGK
jgi:hypothetical protein